MTYLEVHFDEETYLEVQLTKKPIWRFIFDEETYLEVHIDEETY